MTKIDKTELEFDDVEADVLDYYLGGDTETKEQWAQRVWDCCERKFKGENLASVYKTSKDQTWQERAYEIWENKKYRRRESIKRELKIEEKDLKDLKKNAKYSKRSNRDAKN